MIDLRLGDSLKILPTMQDKSVDVSFTSPPYNRKRNDKYKFYDDIIGDYFDFLCKFTDELLRVTKRWTFVNIQQNYYNRQDVFKYLGAYSDKIVDVIIWEKTNPTPSNNNSVTNAYEYFIVMGDYPLKSNYSYTKNILRTQVNSNMPDEHRAAMKQEVADWFIKNFTNEGDTILDIFMGTGTTGVSCKKTHRNFIGIEIEQEYFELSTKKINSTSEGKYEHSKSHNSLFNIC